MNVFFSPFLIFKVTDLDIAEELQLNVRSWSSVVSLGKVILD